MNRFRRLICRQHPMPPLLYLEWLLLGLMLVFAFGRTVLPEYWFFSGYHPAMLAIVIAVFGWMGLYLPVGRPLVYRVGYTGLEFGLIFLFLMIGGLRGLFLPYPILMIRSCFLFGRTGQLGVLALAGLSSGVSWYLFYRRVLTLQPDQLADILTSFGFLFFIVFFLSLFFVLITMNSVINERKSSKALAAANQKLRQYSALVEEQSKLQERHRIAREIHDSLGHSLTGLNLQLEAALALWERKPETSLELVGESRQLAKSSLQDVRQVVKEFRTQEPLKEALQKLTQRAMTWQDIHVELVFERSRFISAEIQAEVYRLVQEALNNIVKHAQATEVTICLETARSLLLTVTDDGQGFRSEAENFGFGLMGMHERVEALGGTCQIRSGSEGGTIIEIAIPLLE